MPPILNFLQSEHVLALLIALLIFLTTILLVVKRWIGFSVTLLLLFFSLAAGLVINHQHDLRHHFAPSSHLNEEGNSSEDFHQHMLQAMENLKIEMATEKENLKRVITQVQEIFDSVDMQKQKLQSFIEEVRDQFQTNYPVNASPHPIEHPSQSTTSEQNESQPNEAKKNQNSG